MKRLLKKLTGYRKGGYTEPETADYEPAGIIHYGEWWFGDYYAEATPHGTYHVWYDDEYLGEYSGQRIEIVEHLHAKGNHDR